jgi:hypothetical protein
MKHLIIFIILFGVCCTNRSTFNKETLSEKDCRINPIDSAVLKRLIHVVKQPDSLSLKGQVDSKMNLIKEWLKFVISEPLIDREITEKQFNEIFLQKFKPEITETLVNYCNISTCARIIRNYGLIKSIAERSGKSYEFYSFKFQTEEMKLLQADPLNIYVNLILNKPSYCINGKVYNYSLQIVDDSSGSQKLKIEMEFLIDDEIARPIYEKRAKVFEKNN